MTGTVRYHTELRIWHSSRFLARAIHGIARLLPKDECPELARRMRRAAIAVPGNIAKGYGSGTKRELVRFLRVAAGSLAELHSHVTLACDLGYAKLALDHQIFSDIADVTHMLDRLLTSLADGSVPSTDDPSS